eukprot:scaffold218119_cov61-Attheya_sp.AAC.1
MRTVSKTDDGQLPGKVSSEPTVQVVQYNFVPYIVVSDIMASALGTHTKNNNANTYRPIKEYRYAQLKRDSNIAGTRVDRGG